MKVLIIDDELLAQESLAELLRHYCPEVYIAGIAGSGTQGLEMILSVRPELVFIDIDMPDMDGFEVLRKLEPFNFEVVFVTAHNQYAVKAFEFCALDYLEKPVDPHRLVKCVHRASERKRRHSGESQLQLLSELIANRDSLDHRIVFATQNDIVFSWLRNLIRIDADMSFSMIKLADQKDPLRIGKNIGEYEKLFDGYKYLMRIHRSHLVNLFHVKRFIREDDTVQMTDGFRIPVATSRREELLERLAALGGIR